MRERKTSTKFSSLLLLFSLSTVNAICYNKKPSGCGPDGAVFMSPISCMTECKGFTRAKKMDVELLSIIDDDLATYSVSFKGKNQAPTDVSYTGMFRFRTGCSQSTLKLFDEDSISERIEVIVSDRVSGAYTNEFVAHRVPKLEKQKDKESAVVQFSRKVTEGEKTKSKGDVFIVSVAFPRSLLFPFSFDEFDSCIKGAQFWFMPQEEEMETKKFDYTKCFLSKRYGEKINWEETYQMPPRNMPKTKTCPNPVEPKDDEAKTKSRPMIAGGSETVKGRWPWFAWTSGTESNFTLDNCGLTILTKNEDGSDDWLITRADCCYFNPKMLIHIGEWNLKEKDDSEFQVKSRGYEFTKDGYERYCFVRVPNLIDAAPKSCIDNSCFEPACLSPNEPQNFTICYSAGFGAAGNLGDKDYDSSSYYDSYSYYDYYGYYSQYYIDYYNAPDQSYVLKDFPVYVENGAFHAVEYSDQRNHNTADPDGPAHCVGDAGSPFICIVDDFPVLTSIAASDRWCQEMPQSITKLPFEEIIEFVNNPPELFEFPDVDWEEPKENLTAGLVCETPLDPVPAEPSPKIIGGKTVPIEHHPYIAWLGFCGGTLITMNDDGRDDFVVSAAHCCEVYEQNGVDILHQPSGTTESSTRTSTTRTSTTISSTYSTTYSSTWNPWRTSTTGSWRTSGTSGYGEFNVILGTSDIEDLGECGQSIEVISYAIHHDYDYNFYGDFESSEEPGIPADICLIKIKNVKDEITRKSGNEALESCKRSISPACLPAEHVPEGSYCKVAGWGDGNNPYNLLHDVGLFTFSNEYCAGTDANDVAETEKYESQFCAGIPDFDGDGFIDEGQNICYGDSGGPLVCEAYGKPVLYGAVSWGAPWCANDNHPGIFAKVSIFTDWILDFME